MADVRTERLHLARRMAGIAPFQVMDILARARELEVQGRDIVHMEIGEPDFPTPQPVVEAAIHALRQGQTHYTPALGLSALREAIAAFYQQRYGVSVSPERIVVTPGASGALLLALGVSLNPGERVLMADPGYPCNRHFVRFLEGEAVAVPVDATTGYQLTRELIERHWDERCAATLIASPSNPTGTLLGREALVALAAAVRQRGGVLISDEIYHGLTYGQPAVSALEIEKDASGRSELPFANPTSPRRSELPFANLSAPSTGELPFASRDVNAFVINSFSKYFQMTGWRLGWLVVPEGYRRAVEKLAQNLFIAASTPAQYAALAAFQPETIAILEERRVEMQRRRDFLLPALRGLGFDIPVTPQGAFYIYADCSAFTHDSRDLARCLLEEAGVAVTPGYDFGSIQPERYLRFAYTTDLARLEEGVARIRSFLGGAGLDPISKTGN